ncbi:MAG TPA: hypothetical protein VGJ45_15740 [Pseudonocardiaceae bacterium]|jgi:hypothetical protein
MDVDALIALWRRYAKANQVYANADQARGDLFGAELCLARGAVRQAAAELLAKFRDDPKTAAETMHRTARGLCQRHWPFAQFDQVAVKYMQSRMWQDCALSIDPSLPEVQPKLSA